MGPQSGAAEPDSSAHGRVAVPAARAGFLSFPKDFTFGAASAAYQIEGAWNEGGRAKSIWDDLTQFPTSGLQTGNVACDHYHRFRDDVAIMARVGLKAYRFSISWPRLIPDGDGAVNPVGAKFYSDLIDALLEHGIQPWVTLYHWDLPSKLNEKFAGWLGPKETVVAAFGHYARTCFKLFGDRVKRWMTLNEPWCVVLAYGRLFEPWPSSKEGPDTDPYTAGHRLILAHAEAVRIYRAEFKAKQGGQLGIAFNQEWVAPKTAGNPADEEAAQRGRDFQLGWFADPVYFGDYPASMKAACGKRLPPFTEAEKALIKGSCDFFGINNYKMSLATPLAKKSAELFNGADKNAEELKDPKWEEATSDWSITPWGIRDLLLYIQKRYSPPGGIAVTENGTYHETTEALALDKEPGALEPKPYGAKGPPPKEDWDNETFDDPHRVRFLKAYLSGVDAARAGGADVRAYFVWSILDNFEWFSGYRPRMGLVRVDYRTQKRTIKASGRWYANVIRDGGFEAPPKSEEFGGAPH